MPSNQAKAIPEPDWNQVKDEIIHLFLTGSIETLRQEMETRGFLATVSQYEAQLRKWGIRKNGTRHDWKSICTLVKIRENENKRTDVYMYGKRVPAAKIKKQMSRYLTALELDSLAEVPPPRVPIGFSVETPKEEMSSHFLQPEAEITLPIRQIMTANLPSSILEQFFIHRGTSLIIDIPYNLECIDPRVLSNSISGLDQEQLSALMHTTTNLHNNALHLISEFRNGTFCNLYPLLSTLRSLLPRFAYQDFERYPNLTMHSEFVNSALTRLIIYSTTNNFSGLGSLPQKIVECLQSPTNMRLLHELQSTKGPEREAFAENVFYAALESSNAGLVQYLLRRSGLDLNKLVCNQLGNRCTPIERAVMLGSKEVTRVLIHAEADLGNTKQDLYNKRGPLEIALGLPAWGPSFVDLELARMLLEAGATLNPEVLLNRASKSKLEPNSLVFLITFYFNASATRKIAIDLLRVVLDIDQYDSDSEDFEQVVTKESQRRRDLAWTVIIGMVQKDFTNAITILAEECVILKSALDMAAERGHLELVKAFLRPGTIPTAEVFIWGVRSGNEELVRYLLDAGADINGHSIVTEETIVGQSKYSRNRVQHRFYTNALAEAIRLGNYQIFQLLQSRGAGLRDDDRSGLGAVLAAASEVGDLRLVRKILRMDSIVDSHGLLDSLLASTRGSQEDVTMMILDSGSGAGAIRTHMEALASCRHAPLLGGIEVESPILQALLHTSRAGSSSIVEKLLALRPMIDQRYLLNPLLASIERNHEQVALMLLNAGAEPSSECVSRALDNQNFKLVNSLLKTGVNLSSSKPRCGWSHYDEPCPYPLLVFKATRLGIYSIVESLIAHGANVDECCDTYEYIPLIEELPFSAVPGTALNVAVTDRDIRLVKLLLDSGADVNSCTFDSNCLTPLAAAVMQGDVSMTDFLLDRGANSADAEALHAGMLRGDSLTEKLVEEFTEQYPHGKKAFGSEMLVKVIGDGNLDLLRRLLLLPLDLNGFVGDERGVTVAPLGLAIMENQGKHLHMVRMLLEGGCDPNRVVKCQNLGQDIGEKSVTTLDTVLLVAVLTGNLEMVDLITSYGAKVNCPAILGIKRTPLQKAAEIGSCDIVEYLLSKGAEINAPPARNGGATALQLAAIGGYIGIAELLLNSGADPNAPAAELNGRTAIEGAAEYGRVDMLRLLTTAGAKMDWRHFETAADLAERNGHLATKKYLETLFHETVSVEELLS